MSARHATLLFAAFGTALALTARAHAQVRLELRPVFGEACLPRSTPGELVARIANDGATPLSGRVVLDPQGPAESGLRTLRAAAFSVAAHDRATVHLSSAGALAGASLLARVVDPTGRIVASVPVAFRRASSNTLVDATPGSRLALALDASTGSSPFDAPWRVDATEPASSQATSPFGDALAPSTLTACITDRDATSGDPILPHTAIGYSNTDLVVADTGTLLTLPARERTALTDYLLTGGSLAILVSHPDELRHPFLAALVGTDVVALTPAPLLPSYGSWLEPSGGRELGRYPRGPTLAAATSFRGGHLHHQVLAGLFPVGDEGLLGATANYGYGRVHLLSWNPARAPALDDPWSLQIVQRIAALTTRRRAARLLSTVPDSTPVPAAVRAALAPRDRVRPGLVIAALALALHGLVAGALVARLLRRRTVRGALVLLPSWSLGVFLALALTGDRVRRSLGRTRSIALIDVAAGMARGAVRRFHGYYSPDHGSLPIEVATPGQTLVAEPNSGSGYVSALATRDRVSLQGLVALPWIPTIVREEGFEDLPGAVTLLPDPSGQVRIVNRLRVPLRSVIVIAPDGRAGWSLPVLRARESRLATAGRPLPAAILERFAPPQPGPDLTWNAGEVALPSLPAPRRFEHLGHRIAALFSADPELAPAWDAALALPDTLSDAPTWKPTPSEPILVAMLERTPQVVTDGGLRVERDQVWLRVQGWGGAP